MRRQKQKPWHIVTQRQLGLFEEMVIDNFAGGGGASTGIETAIGRPIDVAINHDPEAITMHEANHPLTKHYCESVWHVKPKEVTGGRPVGLAWFSPDCKHFSKAKGGKPRDKSIRGLAWVAIRWAAQVRPRVIMLENVEEFTTWGPLNPDGEPCPKRKGQTFAAFVRAFNRLGYQVEYKELIAYEYGTPTTRKRLFLIARCDGRPIVWPEPSHAPPTSPAVKSGVLKLWRTAAECIDWTLPCPSIFERERPLADATLRRIARGIIKYVIEAKSPFIVTCNHGGEGFRGQGIDEPMKTLTASRDAHGIVCPTLIQTSWGERQGQAPRCLDIEKPLGTIMADGVKHSLACATLIKNFGGNYKAAGVPLTEPLHTVTATDHHSLVAANLVRMFGNSNGADIDGPAPTVTAGGAGKSNLVVSHLVKLRGTNIGSATDAPIPTITSGGLHIGEVRAFLHKYYGGNEGARKTPNDNSQSLHDPMHTIPATDRFSLVTIQSINYIIADIGMRMLAPHELYQAQGFPTSYIIAPEFKGKPLSKTAQVKMCGNSVPPPMAEALVRANFQIAKERIA